MRAPFPPIFPRQRGGARYLALEPDPDSDADPWGGDPDGEGLRAIAALRRLRARQPLRRSEGRREHARPGRVRRVRLVTERRAVVSTKVEPNLRVSPLLWVCLELLCLEPCE